MRNVNPRAPRLGKTATRKPDVNAHSECGAHRHPRGGARYFVGWFNDPKRSERDGYYYIYKVQMLSAGQLTKIIASHVECNTGEAFGPFHTSEAALEAACDAD